MKIYTRRGDRGETDLFGGGRVAKTHARVQAYGEVDELNACLGAALAQSAQPEIGQLGRSVQSRLFSIGACLATPDASRRERAGMTGASAADVEALEAAIDDFSQELEPLRSFILPGGTCAAAAFHVARTVCRRAERHVVALDAEEPLDDQTLRYLNRLSDLLFVLARVENHRAGTPEQAWSG